MREKIIIYGAGNNFIFSHYELSQFYDCVGLVDGDTNKIGTFIQEMTVQSLGDALELEYDYVVMTPVSVEGISTSLIEKGVSPDKIISLQEAFDRVPDDEWYRTKHIECKDDANKIGIILYGGMGDLLVAKLWIEKMIRIYELKPDVIELFCSNQNYNDTKVIFSDIVSDNSVLPIYYYSEIASLGEYAITLRFCIIPEIFEIRNTKSSLFDSRVGSYFKQLDDEYYCKYNRGFFTTRKYCDTIRAYLVDRKNTVYHTAYDIWGNLKSDPSDKTTIPLISIDEQGYLGKIDLAGKKYITLNTGLNHEYSAKSNTREWSFENWGKLAEAIKTNYPEVTLVQVGLKLKPDDDIDGVVHLNGNTNLEQISVVLKHALVHIDYDGGLVHVNHMVGGRSIVLLGPSEILNHAYPENIYISSGVCNACEWTTPDWLSRCPKEDTSPRCMENITVDMVISEIDKIIKERV